MQVCSSERRFQTAHHGRGNFGPRGLSVVQLQFQSCGLLQHSRQSSIDRCQGQFQHTSGHSFSSPSAWRTCWRGCHHPSRFTLVIDGASPTDSGHSSVFLLVFTLKVKQSIGTSFYEGINSTMASILAEVFHTHTVGEKANENKRRSPPKTPL